ncbi:hypothetical protein P7G51_02990 [Enterococcus asini]|nr:hypothetical protein [Enterococcus asini]MDT2756347.1 hypothetical protein [Enterococcus asini]
MTINLDALVGKKFGLLKVLSAYRDENKYIHCVVQCDCKKIKDVYYTNLKSGKTSSCGHLEEENRNKFVDMVGQKFGELTVLAKTDLRKEGCVVWLCECSCKEHVLASRRQLTRGYLSKCQHHETKILVGKRFHELEVLTFSEDCKQLYCRCSCGNSLWVGKYNLLNGHTKSCGHLATMDNLPRIDGIVPSSLRKKRPITNTSGVVGVSKLKNNRWQAYITLQKKRYSLGTFQDKASAIASRKNAERRLFQPILQKEAEQFGA